MLAIIISFSLILFKITGIRVVFGILLMLLPFYIFLNNLEFSGGEKAVFSILLGLTIFSGTVYLLGLAIPFKLAIPATFMLLVVIAIVSRRFFAKR